MRDGDAERIKAVGKGNGRFAYSEFTEETAVFPNSLLSMKPGENGPVCG